MNNNLTAYDWFLRRDSLDVFDVAEGPTMEKARKLADWINSHDCRPVSVAEVFDWMYEAHVDYVTSTVTWDQ